MAIPTTVVTAGAVAATTPELEDMYRIARAAHRRYSKVLTTLNLTWLSEHMRLAMPRREY